MEKSKKSETNGMALPSLGGRVVCFMRLRSTAFMDPLSYFHRYSQLTEEAAQARALSIWRSINLPNLKDNILPTRQRADLILRKAGDHEVAEVSLRRL